MCALNHHEEDEISLFVGGVLIKHVLGVQGQNEPVHLLCSITCVTAVFMITAFSLTASHLPSDLHPEILFEKACLDIENNLFINLSSVSELGQNYDYSL